MSSYLNVDTASTVRSRSRSREGGTGPSRATGLQETERDVQPHRRSGSSTRLEDEYETEEEHDKPHTMSTRRGTASQRYTEEEEHTVRKKFDRNLVLFLAFLYLLSFLDRSNIGNARVAGLDKALDLSDQQFDYCLIAFYVTYIVFEWMILLYRLVPAHIYISLCVLAWGLVASLQSTVTSFRQLLALRACLGITEAAFGPGVPFYMTFFYRRSELAYRVGLQISAAPLATSFASSIAWVIIKLTQNGPIESWRAVFLFEGFPSIITAIFAWHFIPDSPETARFLTHRERKVARIRLEDEKVYDIHDSSYKSRDHTSCYFRIKSSSFVKTLSSPIPWLQALIFFSINVSFASLPVFLPTIIKAMSFSALTSQILSAPPYLLSFVFVLVVGHYSDAIPDSRGIFLISCAMASASAYFMIALFAKLETSNLISANLSVSMRYIAIYPAAMGLFSCVVLIITWNLNNQPSRKEKGLAMMVMNVLGQCGPLIGASSYPKTDAPHYVSGMLISGIFMHGVVVLATILRWKLKRMNNEKSRSFSYEMSNMRGRKNSEATEMVEEAEGLIESETRLPVAQKPFRYML